MNLVPLGCFLLLTAAQNAPDKPSAADQAWAEVQKDGKNIEMHEQSQDEDGVKAVLPAAMADVTSFLAIYPGDPRVPEARLISAQVGNLARELQLPDSPSSEQIGAQLTALTADKSLPATLRSQASLMEVMQTLESARSQSDVTTWDRLDHQITDFEQNFPGVSANGKASAVSAMREAEIDLLKRSGDAVRLQALLAMLARDRDPDVAALAAQAQTAMQGMADVKSTPLVMQFTALDGRKIDLAALRGKVVLIDFWATWCPPCRGETPDIVAAYQKYHEEGFEIVGISLDQSKGALMSYVQENKMPWPQYFDGKGWDNLISSHYGIQSIPAMWLIGKDGKLVTEDARDDLAGRVAQLLLAK